MESEWIVGLYLRWSREAGPRERGQSVPGSQGSMEVGGGEEAKTVSRTSEI